MIVAQSFFLNPINIGLFDDVSYKKFIGKTYGIERQVEMGSLKNVYKRCSKVNKNISESLLWCNGTARIYRRAQIAKRNCDRSCMKTLPA